MSHWSFMMEQEHEEIWRKFKKREKSSIMILSTNIIFHWCFFACTFYLPSSLLWIASITIVTHVHLIYRFHFIKKNKKKLTKTKSNCFFKCSWHKKANNIGWTSDATTKKNSLRMVNEKKKCEEKKSSPK